RMGQLIDDLINLSRATRGEMKHEQVDLGDMARTVLSDLEKSSAGRHVEVRIGDGLVLEADPRLMRVVLDNLLGNAWKFTSKQDDACIEVGSAIEDNQKVFFVRDNGAGFDMTYADRLFGAFQRFHSPDDFPGTGIGLATVQRIIHRHGGRIWARSEVGKGATFFFVI
ncbi:MAG TPA: ATP-binding protein, partial [Tepidisphaeraceae bacterium]|nr:ATP-binding protein [Tepidisphaeraceae bacterium]